MSRNSHQHEKQHPPHDNEELPLYHNNLIPKGDFPASSSSLINLYSRWWSLIFVMLLIVTVSLFIALMLILPSLLFEDASAAIDPASATTRKRHFGPPTPTPSWPTSPSFSISYLSSPSSSISSEAEGLKSTTSTTTSGSIQPTKKVNSSGSNKEEDDISTRYCYYLLQTALEGIGPNGVTVYDQTATLFHFAPSSYTLSLGILPSITFSPSPSTPSQAPVGPALYCRNALSVDE